VPSTESRPSSVSPFVLPPWCVRPRDGFHGRYRAAGRLVWDVMRQRGNQYREHLAAPHVLEYEVELLMDGRKLERPVNLCARACGSTGGRRGRCGAATLRHRRPPCRPRPGHRRIQGRQRDRCRVQSGHSCSTPCRARPSKTLPVPKRGAFSAEESARLSEDARLLGIDEGGIAGPTPFSPGSKGTPYKSVLTWPQSAREK
jgi:Protein of unknown function (DUF3141)